MSFLLASAARATVGGRSGQEDAFRLWPAEGVISPKAEGAGLLAVLADGMGGHTGGAVAGQTACKTFADVFAAASSPFEARLKAALQASNEALAKGVEQNSALRGMGCTLVAAWIDDFGLRWTSVGDSLLLLYRIPDVIRLNADHSLGSFLDEQARQNRISRSEARRNRNRNALRSALTGSKIDLIDLRGEPLELRPGDWVLLASDGICSLGGDEIADVVYRFRQSTPEEMADGLIAAVTQKGVVDQDNTTVVAVRVEDGKQPDDVTTRIVMRPPKGEDVDLRTRRIGVSRPVPSESKSRKAAVWLATAAVLLISAAAIMIALPSLRSTVSTSPDAAPAPDTQTLAKPPVEPTPTLNPPSPVPARQSTKAPADQAAQPTAPLTPPRPPGEGEDGARASQSKSSSAKPGTAPTMESRPAGEAEESGPPRAGTSKSPTPAPSPAKPPTEGEDGATQRPGQPRASAAPQPAAPSASQPAKPAGEAEEASTPRPSPSKSSPAGQPASSGAAKPAEGEDAARSSLSKPGIAPPAAKPRASAAAKPAAPPPAKSAANNEPERKRAKSAPSDVVPDDPKQDTRMRSDTLSSPEQ